MATEDAHLRHILYRYFLPILTTMVLFLLLKGKLKLMKKGIFAFFFSRITVLYNKKMEKHKRRLFAGLHDTATRLESPLKVMEIGAGSGANFEFYPDGTELTCLEPNPMFSSYLDENRRRFPHLNFKGSVLGCAEDMHVIPEASVDAVVCSLTLCSVANVQRCMQEILRILKPGGKFYYMEHVCADKSTWVYSFQRLMRPVVMFFGEGCDVTREPWTAIEQGGFSKVEHGKFYAEVDGITRSFLWPNMWPIMRYHLVGIATK